MVKVLNVCLLVIRGVMPQPQMQSGAGGVFMLKLDRRRSELSKLRPNKFELIKLLVQLTHGPNTPIRDLGKQLSDTAFCHGLYVSTFLIAVCSMPIRQNVSQQLGQSLKDAQPVKLKMIWRPAGENQIKIGSYRFGT